MFTSDELNQVKIFACLEETERIRYAEKAADVRLCVGEWLIREGEPPWFFVLFEGRLRMAKTVLGRQEDLAHNTNIRLGTSSAKRRFCLVPSPWSRCARRRLAASPASIGSSSRI